MDPSSQPEIAPPGRLAGLVAQRPFAAFVVLACAIAWGCLLVYAVTQVRGVLFLAGLGPAAAGALVSWRLGTLPAWWERLTRWRVSPWYYGYALGLPVLLYAAANGLAVLYGAGYDASQMDGAWAAYLATWGAALFLGGLEEPGWRGFALPQLQGRMSPVRATLLVGLVWGLWQLPISPLAVLLTVPLSFFYTWLFNRTGSVLLCLLLHASTVQAQEHLVIVADSVGLEAAVVVTLAAAAGGLAVATRGRLGMREPAG